MALQAPLYMRFSSQEYWSGLPFRSPGDLPNSGIEPGSPASQANSLPTELRGNPDITYRWNLKNSTNELTHKTELDSET